MSTWKYVDKSGTVRETAAEELKRLAAEGVISGDTMVTSLNGKTLEASKIGGLESNAPPRPPAGSQRKTSWKIPDDLLTTFSKLRGTCSISAT